MRRKIGLIAVLVGVVALILLIILLSRGILSFLSHAGLEDGAPDPMFPPEETAAVSFTRPPQLMDDEHSDAQTPRDQSALWVYEETSPVDKTPSELAQQTHSET